MKKVILASAALLTASALILSGCKKDEEEPAPVVPTPTGPSLPQSSALVFHVGFDGNANVTSGAGTASATGITWTADRLGAADKAAWFDGASGGAGTGSKVEYSGGSYINASTTISAWYKIDPADFGPGSRFMFGIAGERGYFMEVAGDQAWCKLATAHAVDASGTPDHLFGTAWTDYMNGGSPIGGSLLYNYLNSEAAPNNGWRPLIANSNWHQIVMTYDASTSVKTFYLDGVKRMQADIDLDQTEWIFKQLALMNQNDDGTAVAGIDPVLSIGFAASAANTATGWINYGTATNTWKGAIDEFRIWNVALTEAEVATLYDFEN